MKVSVIVAAYNIEKYIQRCLESISFQTLKDIEIIVVNDGSIDSTLEIIENMANREDRIKIINQQNKGLIEARKSGLNVANGEYVLFVDGDDWIEKNSLEMLYSNAKQNCSDIVMYNFFVSSDTKREKRRVIISDLCSDDYLENIFLNKLIPSIWSKFIRLDFIRKNNVEFPSNISFAEDLATVSSLFMNNPRVSVLEKNLYNYYIREESITNTVNNKVLELDRAFNFIEKLLKQKEVYSKYKYTYEYMIYLHMFDFWGSRYWNIKGIGDELFKKYIRRNINIKENKYINDMICRCSLGKKIRIRLYHRNYNLGKLYDYSLYMKNMIINN